MVRFALVVLVERVELRVGLIAERSVAYSAEVKMEAVQQEVNLHPGSLSLRPHGGGRAQDEGGAVHCAARFVLQTTNGYQERRGEGVEENQHHISHLFDVTERPVWAARLRNDPPPSLQRTPLLPPSEDPPAVAPLPPSGRKSIWGTEGYPHFRLLDHIQVLTRDSNDSAASAEESREDLVNVTKQKGKGLHRFLNGSKEHKPFKHQNS